MTAAASDDLIARVRAYLAGLEPPIRADELTDEEVGEMVLWGIRGQPASLWHSLLPERLQPGPPMIRLTAKPPPPPKPKPPGTVEYVHGGRFLESGISGQMKAVAASFKARTPRERLAIMEKAGLTTTPPEPPPPPR